MVISHDSDFYSWTQQQAALLRQGRWAEADIAHLVEELESMGASERRELINRLAVLLAHLLKWQHQPARRGRSWQLTIEEQRRKSQRVLRQNPGLKPSAQDALEDAYGDARLIAAKEMRGNKSVFPAHCPWSLEQVFNDDFWPE